MKKRSRIWGILTLGMSLIFFSNEGGALGAQYVPPKFSVSISTDSIFHAYWKNPEQKGQVLIAGSIETTDGSVSGADPEKGAFLLLSCAPQEDEKNRGPDLILNESVHLSLLQKKPAIVTLFGSEKSFDSDYSYFPSLEACQEALNCIKKLDRKILEERWVLEFKKQNDQIDSGKLPEICAPSNPEN